MADRWPAICAHAVAREFYTAAAISNECRRAVCSNTLAVGINSFGRCRAMNAVMLPVTMLTPRHRRWVRHAPAGLAAPARNSRAASARPAGTHRCCRSSGARRRRWPIANTKHCAVSTPAKRGKGNKAKVSEEPPRPAERRIVTAWAQRLKRVFSIETETGAACSRPMKVTALVSKTPRSPAIRSVAYPRTEARHRPPCSTKEKRSMNHGEVA